MTAQEANSIIAEFMGNYVFTHEIKKDHIGLPQDQIGSPYHESLDALVPVWGKLSPSFGAEMWKDAGKFSFRLNHTCAGYSISHRNVTIQEAAAITTAKAIKELNE